MDNLDKNKAAGIKLPERPANVILSRHGDLKAGVFYELIIDDDDMFLDFEEDDTSDYIASQPTPSSEELFLQDAGTYISGSLEKVGQTEQLKKCSEDPQHVTGEYWKDVTVYLGGGPHISPLSLLDGDGQRSVLVSMELAEQIKQTEFRGWRLLPVKIDKESRYRKPASGEPKLFELQFMGRNCYRQWSVHHAPNACPWCGTMPLICPDCGYRDIECCDKSPWKNRKEHGGPGDRHLIVDIQNTYRPAILEATRWDGSDFLFGGLEQSLWDHVVSRRVVDWLLSIHAAPFYARPVLIDVEGASDETLARLKVVSGRTK